MTLYDRFERVKVPVSVLRQQEGGGQRPEVGRAGAAPAPRPVHGDGLEALPEGHSSNGHGRSAARVKRPGSRRHERPELVDPYAEIKVRIHREVIEALGPSVEHAARDQAQMRESIESTIATFFTRSEQPLSRREQQRISAEVIDDALGYGPIDRYVRDDDVSEIMVNACDAVYVEREGQIVRTNTRFVDDRHIERIIGKIVSEVGRRVDESSPMVDARLPDGSRINAIIPPLSLTGPCLTIRKFRQDPLTMQDLIDLGTITPRAARFLELCVEGAANVLISGGTGSGKTTTLNVLSAAIPETERIISVEDAAEIQLCQEHVITLESRPSNIEGRGSVTIRDLVRNCLRMRPDRIIVGEVRGAEAVDMLQAMNTGHDGSMTTIHANTARDALARVETLVLTSGVDLPIRAIREQISGALHLVVHVARLVDGSRRITSISEIGRMESGTVTMQDLFVARANDATQGAQSSTRLLGPLRCTGLRPSFLEHLAANGVQMPDSLLVPDDEGLPRTRTTRRFERAQDGSVPGRTGASATQVSGAGTLGPGIPTP